MEPALNDAAECERRSPHQPQSDARGAAGIPDGANAIRADCRRVVRIIEHVEKVDFELTMTRSVMGVNFNKEASMNRWQMPGRNWFRQGWRLSLK